MPSSLLPFREYTSIENHYNTRFVKTLQETGDEKEQYAALEKVHGANFSVTQYRTEYDSMAIVAYGRRGDYLGKEKFLGSETIKSKYESAFIMLFFLVELELGLKPGTVVRIYGEHYGGIYPGQPTKGAKPVQKGVYYTPEYEFVAFDLSIDGEYQDYEKVIGWFERSCVPYCRILHTGTLDDLLKLDPAFESSIYQLHTLPKLERNLAEGYVLKPLIERRLDRGDRVMIKLKNPDFAENVRMNSGDDKQEVDALPLSEKVKVLITQAVGYVNENRYNNLMSKLSEADREIPPKVAGMLCSDALKDFGKEVGNEPDLTDEIRKTHLKPAILAACKGLVMRMMKADK